MILSLNQTVWLQRPIQTTIGNSCYRQNRYYDSWMCLLYYTHQASVFVLHVNTVWILTGHCIFLFDKQVGSTCHLKHFCLCLFNRLRYCLRQWVNTGKGYRFSPPYMHHLSTTFSMWNTWRKLSYHRNIILPLRWRSLFMYP